MDLYAYAMIEKLDAIAKENDIEVPRLRGYRLMSEEEPINYKELFDDNFEAEECETLCECHWRTNSHIFELSSYTTYLKDYYTVRTNGGGRKIRWNRIHGRKRKILKTAIHNKKQRYKKQFEVWNKYIGRKDILYIHARIGGRNWPYYFNEVVNQPWFIEKVDDAWDSTYCDIYAKIKEPDILTSETKI